MRKLALAALMLAGLTAGAIATITSAANKVVAACNGATTSFAFSFVGVAAADISVTVTTSAGVATTLATNQYTLALNAAAPGQLWGNGGTVTYPLGGPACPAGSTVTILRTLPLTQSVSLQNQASFGQYARVAESALDQLAMQIQQVSEAAGRQIRVAISDGPVTALPPAAQRANQWMAFDGTGNPVAASAPGGAVPISTAMQPVVSAASTSAALAALGIAGVSPEPPGVIKAYGGSAAPTGYLLCAGQAVSRTTFAALFAVFGTLYGPGDGSTTFNLPDLRGRVIAAPDNMGGIAANRLTATTITGGATVLGNSGGTQTNTVTVGKMPAHAHAAFINDPGHAHTISPSVTGLSGAAGSFAGGAGTPAPTGFAIQANTTGVRVRNAIGTLDTTDSTGGGNPLEIVQPTIILNYICKT